MRRSVGVKLLAASVAMMFTRTSVAAPGAVYAVGAPSLAPPDQSAALAADNVTETISREGELSFTKPFVAPPGRAGIQPKIRLAYSSRAQVRGGIAAGWTLPISRISVDTTLGRAQTTTYEVDGTRLVEVAEPNALAGRRTFRADGDPDFVRYEKLADGSEGGTWLARRVDGTTTYYGTKPWSKDTRVEGSVGDTRYGGEGRWFISQVIDAAGNAMDYTYEPVYGAWRNDTQTNKVIDLVPVAIEYGRNLNVAGSVNSARIELAWKSSLETCVGSTVPVGAQFTYRTGIRQYVGAKKLLALRALARPSPGAAYVLRREMTLGYDTNAESCNQLHGPMRVLTSIQERAISPDGISTSLPPSTYEYGPFVSDFSNSAPLLDNVGLSWGREAHDRYKPGGWPALGSLPMDLDGDGLSTIESGCAGLPKVPWANGSSANDDNHNLSTWEGCSLTAQVTHRRVNRGAAECGAATPTTFFGYRFMDVNDDGLPDLVAAMNFNKGQYRPSADPALAANYPACSTMPAPACTDAQGDRIPCLLNRYIERVDPILPGDQSFVGLDNGLFSKTGSTDTPPIPGDEHGTCGTVTCPSTRFCVQEAGCCDEDACSSGGGPLGDPPEPTPTDWKGGLPPVNEQISRAPSSDARCGYVSDMHCGRYVWYVYLNKGNQSDGSWFVPQPRIVYSPISLESDQMASFSGTGALANASMWRGTADLDGDGYPDAIYQTPNDLISPNDWPSFDFRVWWGDGRGGFREGAAHGTGWPTPLLNVHTRPAVQESYTSLTPLPGPGVGIPYLRRYETKSKATLRDLNGDGLLDYVLGATVFYNTGRGFESAGTRLDVAAGIDTLDRRVRTVLKNAWDGDDAFAQESTRLIDLDRDGLDDLVVLSDPEYNQYNPFSPPSGGTIRAYLNTGDGFTALSAAETTRLGVWRQALAGVTVEGAHLWESKSDVVDVNGDGLPDLVESADFSLCPTGQQALYDLRQCGRQLRVRYAPTAALRLMTAINNGVGARTIVEYASTKDTATVAKPAGSRLSAATWVVRKMTTTSGTTNEAAKVTEYQYEKPISNLDRFGRFAFRGFARTTVTGPQPSTGRRLRTISDWAFDQDPLGRLQRELVGEVWSLHDGHEDLVKVTEVEWQQLPMLQLLAEQAPPVYAWGERTRSVTSCRTPKSGMLAGVAACLADGLTKRDVLTWSPLYATSGAPFPSPLPGALVWTVVEQRLTDSPSTQAVPGDRLTMTESQLRSSSSEYHLLTTTTTTKDGNGTVLAKDRTTYETGTRALPIEKQKWLEGNTTATTRFAHDAFGNVRQVTPPREMEKLLAGQPASVETRTYDPFGLFVASTTNLLGHTKTQAYDRATGVVTYSTGVAQPTVTPYERRTIDGFGRTIEIRRLTGAAGAYSETLVEKNTWTDWAPRSVKREVAREAGKWLTTITKLDGLGRVIQIELPTGSGTEVTRQLFDGAGNTIAIYVPNPAGAGESLYWLQYDAFKQLTVAKSPDTAQLLTTYSGASTTAWEAPNDMKAWSYRRSEFDARGRVKRIYEGFPNSTVTTYEYDALDRVVGIVDADGVATTVSFDLAGRRRVVQRAQSRLEMQYDAHGNKTVTLYPTPSGAPDPLKYASYATYDALDRLTSVSPMTRDLTKSQVGELSWNPSGETLTTLYAYDDPTRPHGIGHLTQVGAPHGTTTYDYSIEGFTTREARALQVRPEQGVVFAHDAEERRTYDLLGNLLTAHHADGTETKYAYDERGRPKSASMLKSNGVEIVLGLLRRNAAGKVERRETGVPGLEQSWTYDGTGRVLDSVVSANASIVAGERYRYFETGQVKDMTDLASGRTIELDYDERVELISAKTPGSNAYVGSFSYSPSGRVKDVKVASDLPGAEVVNRNVTHQYGGSNAPDRVDPSAVRSLRNIDGGDELAALTYDAGGNLRRRTQQGMTTDFIVDGLDQVREARDQSTGQRELYWYDHNNKRVLTWRSGGPGDQATLRHRFGNTEIFVAGSGTTLSSTVDVPLGATSIARVKNADPSNVELLFHGALGNLIATATTKGEVSGRFGYGPWGERLYSEGSTSADYDLRYQGKQHDALSRLDYFGYRYYDALTMSWTQADPLYRRLPERGKIEPRRMNLYAYVQNNPLGLVDPDGLEDDSLFSGAVMVKLVEKAAYNQGDQAIAKIEAKVGTGGLEGSFSLYSLDTDDGSNGFSTQVDLMKAEASISLSGVEGKAIVAEAGESVRVGPVKAGVSVGLGYEMTLSWKKGLKCKAIAGIGGEIEVNPRMIFTSTPTQLSTNPYLAEYELSQTFDEDNENTGYTYSTEDPAPQPKREPNKPKKKGDKKTKKSGGDFKDEDKCTTGGRIPA